MTTLSTLLLELGVSQAAMARALRSSETTISRLVKHGEPPRRRTGAFLAAFRAKLVEFGARETDVDAAMPVPQPDPWAVETPPDKEIIMTLKHHSLTQQARQAFGIFSDPFDAPQKPEDVFLTPQIRYVREAMFQAATHGNFLAVIGESGSGKSTLRRELIARLKHDAADVVIIQPYILTMSTRDNGAGKPLRAAHIIEAIIAAVEPDAMTMGSPERMAQRVHEVLRRSAKANNRHVLIIEEAHDMHTQTLKALKRFYELEDGMRRLLSIILIGQTELGERLSTAAADVREVVQRIDQIRLSPLVDVGDYLRFRFERAGLDALKLFSPDAFTAIKERLIVARDKRGAGVDMAYPLPVDNVAAACLNEAAAGGFALVNEDIVRSVKL